MVPRKPELHTASLVLLLERRYNDFLHVKPTLLL